MKEFQQKKKRQKVTRSKWLLLTLLVISFLLLSSSSSLHQRKARVLKFQKESQIELGEILEKKERIEKEMGSLDSERGREHLIRTKYNVKTPGEEVIIVTDADRKEEGVPVVKRDIWYTLTHLFE
jgi:cell division protein FtsB